MQSKSTIIYSVFSLAHILFWAQRLISGIHSFWSSTKANSLLCWQYFARRRQI